MGSLTHVVEKLGAAKTPAAVDVTEEPESFEAFFRQQYARLFGTLCLITGDARAAEELMQEAFVRVWERWDHVRGHSNPPGYLYRTAVNLSRDRLSRLKRAARTVAGASSSEDAFARVEMRADLLRALRNLSRRQRAAVVLIDMLDLSSEEAGELLGVRAVTVRVLASQARAALRSALGATDV